MKKIFISFSLFLGLSLVSLNDSLANTTTYNDFSNSHKEIKKYDKVLNIELGKELTEKKKEELGIYQEGQDESKKLNFLKARKLKNELLGLEISDITLVEQDKKIQSILMEFNTEMKFKELANILKKKMGTPLSYNQDNEYLTYVWGISYKDSQNKIRMVRPIILNFNLYEEKGVVIWTSPEVEYSQNNNERN